MKNTPNHKYCFELAIQYTLNSSIIKGVEEQEQFLLLNHFIKRTLKQFKLNNICVEDVISEVYLRGVKLINSGEEIRNPGAWIRVTSYNVIREMHRKKQKEQPNSELVELKVSPQETEDNQEKEQNLLKLKKLLQTLNEKDKQILELRFFQDKSWQEVIEYLVSQGEIVTNSTVRQRGSRALKRLRKAYLDDSEN